MNNDKNLNSNNGTVDEELLRGFFADSVRMHIADGDFSHRVMQRLPEEMPARQIFLYHVWSAACAAVCVVAFFLVGGVDTIKGYIAGVGAYMAGLLPRVSVGSIASRLDHSASLLNSIESALSLDTIVSGIQASGSTLLMAALTVVVLGSLAVWDVAQSDALS